MGSQMAQAPPEVRQTLTERSPGGLATRFGVEQVATVGPFRCTGQGRDPPAADADVAQPWGSVVPRELCAGVGGVRRGSGRTRCADTAVPTAAHDPLGAWRHGGRTRPPDDACVHAAGPVCAGGAHAAAAAAGTTDTARSARPRGPRQRAGTAWGRSRAWRLRQRPWSTRSASLATGRAGSRRRASWPLGSRGATAARR